MARGTTVFQEEIRPGAGFKTGDFVKEKLGVSTTVERLKVEKRHRSVGYSRE